MGLWMNKRTQTDSRVPVRTAALQHFELSFQFKGEPGPGPTFVINRTLRLKRETHILSCVFLSRWKTEGGGEWGWGYCWC